MCLKKGIFEEAVLKERSTNKKKRKRQTKKERLIKKDKPNVFEGVDEEKGMKQGWICERELREEEEEEEEEEERCIWKKEF